MSDHRHGPPHWAEFALERVLAARDRQTVTGDLREEYDETILPRVGRFRADLWYLRQALTLIPLGLANPGRMRTVLLPGSILTSGFGWWLAFMECVLRHPGYVARSAVDVAVACVPLTTVLVLCLHLGRRAERWLWAGAVALIGVSGQALWNDEHAGHFEGFALIIGVAWVLQGVLMLMTLGRTDTPTLAGDA